MPGEANGAHAVNAVNGIFPGLDLDAARLHPSPVADRSLPMIRPLLLALLLAGTAASAQAQDLVIRGGPIYTGVDARPTAEVVQVRDGRIAYVGPAVGPPPPTA